MRKARMIAIPVAMLMLLLLLSFFEVQIDAIAEFTFIWDVMLGIALGVGLVLLPSISGYQYSLTNHTTFLWVCGVIAMVLIFCQYMTTVIGIHAGITPFLPQTNARMRIVEGVFAGYCSFAASLGKK